MRRLLCDLIRQRSMALGVSGSAMLVGVIVWIVTGMQEPAEMRALLAAFAAVMAFAIGPQVTARYMERNIWYLPLSRRDVWRARWIFASVVTPLCVVPALILPALVERTANAAEAAALSILYAFAYAGFGCALIAIATRPIGASAPRRHFDAAAASLADLLLPLAFLVPILTRQFTPWRPPMHVADITPLFAAWLVVAFGAWIAAYFYTPPPVGRTVRAYAAPEAPARHTSRASQPGARSAFRLAPGGWPLLLAHEYAWALLLASAFTLFSVGVVVVMTDVWRSPREVVDLLRLLVRLFDGAPAANSEGIQAFGLLVVFGIFVASLGTRLPVRLRHLRVLPISSAQINLLLIAWPAAIWVTAWGALLLLHYALIGDITSWHLAGLFAWIGATALIRAIVLRLSNSIAALVFAALLLAAPFLLFVKAPSSPLLALLALAWLAGAASLNRAALRRNTTYRRADLLLGVMPVLQPPD